MRRVVLKAKEKKRVLDAFSVWDPSGLDRTALESVSQEHGVAAVDAYTTVLHLDSLFAIGPETPLVWKGGTAIQSLLPGPVQRISVDLDFNSTTPNVEILRESIEQANRMLDRSGRIVTIGPIHFGEFFEADHRPHYKTIEFRRLMPSLFDDKATVPDGTFEGQEDAIKIQGRLSRLQINYAHHGLPALLPEETTVRFFTQPHLNPTEKITAIRASAHDLVADKILATTRVHGFGRERFKDLYDLIALRHHGAVDLETVAEKLTRIVGKDRVQETVEGSLETMRILSVETARVQGFEGSVCRDGKRWVRRWDRELPRTIDWLLPLTGTQKS